MSNPAPSGEMPPLQEETTLLFQQKLWASRIQNSKPFTEEEAARLKQLWLDLLGSAFNRDHIQHVDGMVHIHLTPETHLHLSRDGVHVKGPVTEDAIIAGLQHVKQTWGAVCYINPDLSPAMKLQAWKLADKAGVTIANYAPSKEEQLAYFDQKTAAARRTQLFGDASPAAGSATPPPATEAAPASPAAAAPATAPQQATRESIDFSFPVHYPPTPYAVRTNAVAPRPTGDIVDQTPTPEESPTAPYLRARPPAGFDAHP